MAGHGLPGPPEPEDPPVLVAAFSCVNLRSRSAMNCCCSASNCDGSIGAAVESPKEFGTTAIAGAFAGVVLQQRKKLMQQPLLLELC